VTINGQPASLTTSESVDSDVTVRQVIGVFQSKDGSTGHGHGHGPGRPLAVRRH
jgi:hypothetical protein